MKTKTDFLPLLILKLWKYLSLRRKSQFILLLCLIILNGITEIISISLVIPFLSVLTNPEYILDNSYVLVFADFFNLRSQTEIVTTLFIGFILVIIFSGLIKSLNFWINFNLSAAIGSDLSTKAFRRTLNQDYIVHINRNTSKILSSLVTDIGKIIGLILNPTLTLISSLILFLFLIIGLIIINPSVAFILSSLVLFFYFITYQIIKSKIKKLSKQQVELDQNLFKIIQEGTGAIRDILINGNQEMYENLYYKIDKRLRISYANSSFFGLVPRLVIEPFLIISLFLIGFLLIKQEGLENALPILAAIALISQKLLPLIQMIYQSITQCKTAKESLINIIALMEIPFININHFQKKSLRFHSSIKVSNLTFSYNNNSKPIFRKLNFEIKKGEKIGIIGTTGSGKSTLADIIMGLLKPNSGKILVDGENIFDENSESNLFCWRNKIASVPQSIFLADCSIAENIAFGVPKEFLNINKVKKCIKQANLTNFVKNSSNGLNTIVGERGVKLSGGQRQRIGIARALYKNSEILFLDESTSALDIYTEKSLMQTINNLGNHLTVIIIAHRYSTLENCDRILKIEGGEIKDVELKMLSEEQNN